MDIPFDASNRHVAFQGRVNGHDGMRLVLDTGAGTSVIDGAHAELLGLESTGKLRAMGAVGAEQGSTVRGVDIELPGLKFLDQTMAALPLGAISAQAGRPLDAILGRSFFERSVVEIDYARKRVNVFDAADYEYRGSGVSLPLTFSADLPYVKARVVLLDGKSLEGKFVIDTGASTNVILSMSTVEREGVVASMGKTMSVRQRGVGGASDMKLGRVSRLELGGFALAQPVVALQPAGPGIISAEGSLGNIGGGILSRFKVIFDYSRRRMILEPGPDLAAPFEADMSGLSLTSAAPDFRRVSVARVLDGSPAKDSGIQAGDEVMVVDGEPAGDIGLSALRERLRRDDKEFRLEVQRGTERIAVSMRTRRMI